MELRQKYDVRRLILARSKNSTGLWFPPYGASGLQLPSLGSESAHSDWHVVRNGDGGVRLPNDLAEEISAWLARSSERKLGVTKDGLALAKKLAKYFGRQKQIEFAGKVVLPETLPAPYTKEFVFGEEYAQARNRRDFRSINAYRTYLSYVLREEMSFENQKDLFPTSFHLGSGVAIDPSEQTWAILASELVGIKVNGDEARNQYKRIREKLPAILGEHVIEPSGTDVDGFSMRSKWMKVVGLLHVLGDREINGKKPQLMNMLTLPVDGGDFSLSLTSIYPFESARESSWLIGDLKSHLGSELDENKFRWIVWLYEGLIPYINVLINSTKERLRDSSESAEEADVKFEQIFQAISVYEPKIKQVALPLDENLFRHIHLLEYAHFVVAYPQLIDVAKATCKVRSISDEIEDWMTNAGFIEEGKDDVLMISEVPQFAYAHQEAIKLLMEKAIGEHWNERPEAKVRRSQWPGKRSRPIEMSTEDYGNLVAVGQNLLKMHRWMHDNEFPSDLTATPIQLLAAFCCAWFTVDDATSFAPKWLGSKTQGGKLSESLEKPIFSEESGMDKMPMEHRHILSLRTSHFENAIRGRSELEEKHLGLIVLLLKKIREICASNEMKTVSDELLRFKFFVQEGIWKV